MKKLIIALTLLCSLCLFAACTEGQNESDQNGNGEPPAQTEEIRTVELGISRIDFTAKIIDASKETPVCYVDVESQLRKEDKSAYAVLVDYFDADLFCLAVNLECGQYEYRRPRKQCFVCMERLHRRRKGGYSNAAAGRRRTRFRL